MSDIIYWKKSAMRFPAQAGKPVAITAAQYAACCNCTTRPLYSVSLQLAGYDGLIYHYWFDLQQGLFYSPESIYHTWNGKLLSQDAYAAATVAYAEAVTDRRGDETSYGAAGATYVAICLNTDNRFCVKIDGGVADAGTTYSGYIAVRFASLLDWNGRSWAQGGTGSGAITDARRFDFSGALNVGGGELGSYIFTLGWELSDTP